MLIINDGLKLEVDDPILVKRIIGMALSQFSGTREFLKTEKDRKVTRKEWTAEDDNILITKLEEGKAPRQVAAMLDRTQRAIHSRIWALKREGRLKKIKLT